MAQRWISLVLGLGATLGACSVLNAPDDALTTGDEPADGGEPNMPSGGMPSGGTGATAGSTSQAGDGGMGAVTGVGGCGSDCEGEGEGGAPPLGRECESSADDCASTAPICDATAGECRACAADDECESETGRRFCVTSGAAAGRCAECKKSTDCSGGKPVCGNVGLCRACTAHDECASGVCEASGSCGAPATAVYALAETGVSGTNCGTIDTPCFNLSTAASKLTAARNTLVLVKTPAVFSQANVALPAIQGIRVIGNGVKIRPGAGAGFTVSANGSAHFEDVFIENVTASDKGAITCTGGSIVVSNSTLQNNTNAVVASDCEVSVTDSLIQNNDQPHANAQAAVRATCTIADCSKKTAFLRNKFIENGVAAYVANQASVQFENNLFLGNGADGYTRVIELRAESTYFGYNTLVGNFNTCTYVGIVDCIGECTHVANISYDNFPNYASEPASRCYDQVWYGGTMSYNLTEVPFPGATNRTGDPQFVDAANGDFTPGAGSPAIDNGSPDDIPQLDLNGRRRPVGDGSDIGAIEAR